MKSKTRLLLALLAVWTLSSATAWQAVADIRQETLTISVSSLVAAGSGRTALA